MSGLGEKHTRRVIAGEIPEFDSVLARGAGKNMSGGRAE